MSLVTVSAKKGGRVYARKFDHEEAVRLRSLGWTYGRLAERFGVSPRAVARVCDPAVRAKVEAQTREYLWRRREPCLGCCGRLVWAHLGNRSGYCPSCAAQVRLSDDIRDDELRCTRCREWKPDSDFATGKPTIARRGRNSMCRLCETAVRREYRRTHRAEERDYERKRREERVAEYIVLQPNGTGDTYRVVGRGEARSIEHAIEKHASEPGSYIAVLASYFRLMHAESVQALRVVSE